MAVRARWTPLRRAWVAAVMRVILDRDYVICEEVVPDDDDDFDDFVFPEPAPKRRPGQGSV